MAASLPAAMMLNPKKTVLREDSEPPRTTSRETVIAKHHLSANRCDVVQDAISFPRRQSGRGLTGVGQSLTDFAALPDGGAARRCPSSG
jgi:hypothetical protein